MWYINSEIFKTTQGGKKMSEVKDSVSETPSQNYTKEQILFCAWLNSMKKLEMIPAEERTFKQNQEISDLKMKMWQTIVKYARSKLHQMMSSYPHDATDDSDIEQSMCVIFLEQLHNYDPLKTTPTTFFTPYFKQVISQHIRDYKQQLTQHDASNARKINRVINEYEKRGIHWTIEMIATQTNLSYKVVKSTIYYAHNAQKANLEDAGYIQSKIPTPEEAIELQEANNILYDAIQRCTTPEEAELLARRINPDGKKEKPYDLVAKQSGKSIKRVKSQLNQAVCKLNQDDTLRKRFGKINRYSDLRPLELQDNSSALLEQQLETFLSEISSVTEDL